MKVYRYTLEASKEELIKAIANLQVRLEESYKREDILTNKLKEANRRLFTDFNGDECWVWDADNVEGNYIESLVCPVVISSSVLQGYLEDSGKI